LIKIVQLGIIIWNVIHACKTITYFIFSMEKERKIITKTSISTLCETNLTDFKNVYVGLFFYDQ